MVEDADGAPPAKEVVFFPTCLLDVFDPTTAEAATQVLELGGCRVATTPEARCCGQPAFNLGHWDEAARVARHTIEHLDRTDGPIVVPSGSCTAMMTHHWAQLFEDDGSAREEQVRRVSRRVVEWSRFLVEETDVCAQLEGNVAHSNAPHPPLITLHPSCHALRELGIRDEPLRLLEAAGIAVVPLPDAETCCGFGGAFSVEQPEMSGGILRAKLDQIDAAAEAGAERLLCLDQGCLMHMAGGADKRGCSIATDGFQHPARMVLERLAKAGRDADPMDEDRNGHGAADQNATSGGRS